MVMFSVDVVIFLALRRAGRRGAAGGRGEAELLGGAGEALRAGGGLEEAQAFERGQEQHAKNLPTGHCDTTSSHILALAASRLLRGKRRKEKWSRRRPDRQVGGRG